MILFSEVFEFYHFFIWLVFFSGITFNKVTTKLLNKTIQSFNLHVIIVQEKALEVVLRLYIRLKK